MLITSFESGKYALKMGVMFLIEGSSCLQTKTAPDSTFCSKKIVNSNKI